MNTDIKRPSWFLNLTEGFRALIDLIRGFFFISFYKARNQGNQAPVLIIPGFLGSDFSTSLLRRFLTKLGYTPYKWGLGRNMGRIKDIERLVELLETLHQKHNQKVVLIGWSLGGVYAREIAKLRPELVEQIFTLGSPFANLDAPNHARWLFEYFNKKSVIEEAFKAQIHKPAPVRTTAIYSKRDGIVPWEACMEIDDELHVSIETTSSHLGFVAHPKVLEIIAERI